MAPNHESYNLDELEPPTWLNQQYMKDVLRSHENDDEVEVISINITPASGKGDHYASIMFRVVVEYQSKNGISSKSLIVKTMPEEDGHKKQMLNESHVFQTEIGMYTEMLPMFEEILREAGDNTKLCVPCIYHSLEPRRVLVFEDLLPQGYAVMRDRCPTYEEICGIFSKMAKWHAVSYKLYIEQPDLQEKFKYSLMELPGIDTDPWVMSGMDNFIEMLDTVSDLRVYKAYFEQIRPNLIERCKESFMEHKVNRQVDAYYVLCHGDFHLRNLMFKHNKVSGAFEDGVLLDFQMSNVGPLPNDIIYAIYLMMSPEQRVNQRDDLIYFYFTNFIDTLKKIKFEGVLPSLVEFRRQFIRHKYSEFFLLTTLMPVIKAVRGGNVELSKLIECHESRAACYRDDVYIDEVRSHLKRFLHQGYFEDL